MTGLSHSSSIGVRCSLTAGATFVGFVAGDDARLLALRLLEGFENLVFPCMFLEESFQVPVGGLGS